MKAHRKEGDSRWRRCCAETEPCPYLKSGSPHLWFVNENAMNVHNEIETLLRENVSGISEELFNNAIEAAVAFRVDQSFIKRSARNAHWLCELLFKAEKLVSLEAVLEELQYDLESALTRSGVPKCAAQYIANQFMSVISEELLICTVEGRCALAG